MRRGCLIAGLLLSLTLGSRSSEAQYTANFQTNIISGVISNWSGEYDVGSNTFADVLLIQNGGVFTNTDAFLGLQVGSSNNTVLVTDPSSDWSIGSPSLIVGYSGAGNSVVVSNGGKIVVSDGGTVGFNSSGSNNSIIVTGSGSIWSNYFDFYLGYSGPSNRFTVDDGGQMIVWLGTSYLGGFTYSSSNNLVLITGPGSLWKSYQMSGGGVNSSIIVSNGGVIDTGSGTFGYGYGNTMIVAGTGSVWSNWWGDAFIGAAWGSNNCLVVKDGGRVVNRNGIVGWGGANCRRARFL